MTDTSVILGEKGKSQVIGYQLIFLSLKLLAYLFGVLFLLLIQVEFSVS